MKPGGSDNSGYEETISHNGHRLTPQRREVYDALLSSGLDHPTATEVFLQAKQKMPSISLATVYNCLETLVDCGLAKQVNVEREATRYCPNLQDHGHFFCERCGKVYDVPTVAGKRPDRSWAIPKGFVVNHCEINLRGICATCDT